MLNYLTTESILASVVDIARVPEDWAIYLTVENEM
jgi:hypothetical protein